MTRFRCLLRDHRLLAAWIVGLALLMKLIVPAGYMIAAPGGTLRIVLCSGYGPVQPVMAGHAPAKQAMTMPGMVHQQDKTDHHGRGGKEPPCVFSALSGGALPMVDAVLLAVVLAFIIVRVFRAPLLPVRAGASYLRPPLRGPPATA